MIIENIRYEILSQGESLPEKLPNTKDIFNLRIRIIDPELQEEKITTACLTAENVESLGPYGHVLGEAQIGDEDRASCEAKYVINGEFALNSPIGELVLKKASEEF